MGLTGRRGELSVSRGRARGLIGTALAGVLSLLLCASAMANAPELLFRASAEGKPGSGAGELNNPRGIAGDPATGHVYVSDLNNSRISEFTAWGSFVKAWGWGVANGASEPQSCAPAEPEASPTPSLCQARISGTAKGQLSNPLGLTGTQV